MRGVAVLMRLGFVVLAGCSVRTSCNAGPALDMDNARRFVSEFVEQHTTVKPTNVTCPERVKAEKGAKFVCTFEVGGVSGTLTMEQTDTEGSVSVSALTGIIASSKIEERVKAELAKHGKAPTIDCGPRVHPSKPADVITCDARDGDAVVGRVSVTIKDQQNNVSFAFVPTSAPAPSTPSEARAEPTP
jgi:hypothetical protein